MEDNWIQIHQDPIALPRVLEFITDPRAGGIASFLGITRAEENAAGQDLIALDYSAYNAMALNQMENMAVVARTRWPICRLAILHRTGRVAIGQPSVMIVVSCPHRSDAFEACRWLIDELKKDVAIWKKEVWADGNQTWVHPESSSR